jgi:hypothetical protein
MIETGIRSIKQWSDIGRDNDDPRMNCQVTNFGQWVRIALFQHRFVVVGGWEDPRVIMPDECVRAAFTWLMAGHVSKDLKSAFIFDALLQEGNERRAALLFDALRTGDFSRLMREHVEDLVTHGGHLPMLLEATYGPDTRTDYDRSR